MEEMGGSNHAMRQRCLGAPLLLSMALLSSSPGRGDQFTYLIIDHPAATNYTSLSAVNNSGQIVGKYSEKAGVHGFLYGGGIFTTIDVPNASATTLTGINDAGLIVGSYNQDSFLPHSFLYSGRGFTPINVPTTPMQMASTMQVRSWVLMSQVRTFQAEESRTGFCIAAVFSQRSTPPAPTIPRLRPTKLVRSSALLTTSPTPFNRSYI